jgi:DNA-binding IclR family transcriptional regulator
MSKSPDKSRRPRAVYATGGVQSVEVGMRVLCSLADLGGEESLGKIAEHVGMPSAKAHRYLASLTRAGFVERSNNNNRYMLGGMALRIGLVALSRVDVIAAAHMELAELRDTVDASLLLAVWGTNGPTIVRWLEPARPVTVNVRVGSNMPLLRSATGQVFAALLPQSMTHSLIKADLNEIKKLQGKAPTLHEAKEALKTVRRRGLGHTAGGVLPGVLALAAPIYDHDNQLAAVVTALGPAGHFDDSLTGPTARALLASSRRLSERMGSTVHSPGSGDRKQSARTQT